MAQNYTLTHKSEAERKMSDDERRINIIEIIENICIALE